MVNNVFYVEKFIYRVSHENYAPSEEEIRRVGETLGQPTKKLDAVLSRYKQVFGQYIVKRCSEIDSNTKVCIYTWNQKVPFKVFPASMHAFGTIILFKGEEPVELLAYPMPKALSYAKSPGLPREKYGDVVPREATVRIDGWQITAYFNPVLNKWMFATRYVLHNMYFEAGKLITEDFNNIANPYVYVAHRIAEEQGIYEKLSRFEKGWTFTLVLEGPEPAITRPPYPLGEDYQRYKLYLLFARDPQGKLYTWSESRSILGIETPQFIKPEPLDKLYEEVSTRLDVRSYMAYIDVGDPENPIIAELESQLYPDAMFVKYLYDAKSAAIIACEGFGEKLHEIVDPGIKEPVKEINSAVGSLMKLLEEATDMVSASEAIVNTLDRYRPGHNFSKDEVIVALKSKNVKRVVKKALSILLEGRSLATRTTIDIINEFVQEIRLRIKA